MSEVELVKITEWFDLDFDVNIRWSGSVKVAKEYYELALNNDQAEEALKDMMLEKALDGIWNKEGEVEVAW